MNMFAIIAIVPLWMLLMLTVGSSNFSFPALGCTSCVISNKKCKALTLQKQNVMWDDKFCHGIVVNTQFKRVKIDMQIAMIVFLNVPAGTSGSCNQGRKMLLF